MAKFTNEQLAALARPASVTEEQKLENAENAVKNALSNYSLASGEYEVFGQVGENGAFPPTRTVQSIHY